MFDRLTRAIVLGGFAGAALVITIGACAQIAALVLTGALLGRSHGEPLIPLSLLLAVLVGFFVGRAAFKGSA